MPKPWIAVLVIFVVAAAGCQKDTRVLALHSSKPAKVVVVARATQVSTEHATADVATLEVHDIFVRGERTRVRVEVPERAEAIVVLFSGGKRCVAAGRSSPRWHRAHILHAGARHQRQPRV